MLQHGWLETIFYGDINCVAVLSYLAVSILSGTFKQEGAGEKGEGGGGEGGERETNWSYGMDG